MNAAVWFCAGGLVVAVVIGAAVVWSALVVAGWSDERGK